MAAGRTEPLATGNFWRWSAAVNWILRSLALKKPMHYYSRKGERREGKGNKGKVGKGREKRNELLVVALHPPPWCATLAPAVLELRRILAGPAWRMNAGARQSAAKLLWMQTHLWCGFNQQQHHISDVTSIPRCLSLSWRWLHGATVQSANASISDVAGVRFALTQGTQSRRWDSMTRRHLSSSRCDSWQVR